MVTCQFPCDNNRVNAGECRCDIHNKQTEKDRSLDEVIQKKQVIEKQFKNLESDMQEMADGIVDYMNTFHPEIGVVSSRSRIGFEVNDIQNNVCSLQITIKIKL